MVNIRTPFTCSALPEIDRLFVLELCGGLTYIRLFAFRFQRRLYTGNFSFTAFKRCALVGLTTGIKRLHDISAQSGNGSNP